MNFSARYLLDLQLFKSYLFACMNASKYRSNVSSLITDTSLAKSLIRRWQDSFESIGGQHANSFIGEGQSSIHDSVPLLVGQRTPTLFG